MRPSTPLNRRLSADEKCEMMAVADLLNKLNTERLPATKVIEKALGRAQFTREVSLAAAATTLSLQPMPCCQTYLHCERNTKRHVACCLRQTS